MKVLNVVDGVGWTGGVEQAFLLARELLRRNIDTCLAVNSKNPVVSEARSAKIPVCSYELSSGRIGSLLRLRQCLGKGFDIAIGHKPGAVRDLIPLVGLAHRGTRFIGVRRVSYPVGLLTVYRFPEKVVAVSNSVRETLIKSGLQEKRIAVIPSGVDLERFRPSRTMREAEREKMRLKGKIVLLNLAKFVPAQKGQSHLFSAVSALRERYRVKLLLAGIDTDGPAARRMVSDFGLQNDVKLLGFRRDIPELLNAADFFVFPSRPGLDAIAGSVLQAMACGKTVISSAVGGIPEYLRDGENGYLVPPGDDEQLHRALEKALSMTAQSKERMGNRARETVQEGYSVSSMAASYVALFEQVLSQRF